MTVRLTAAAVALAGLVVIPAAAQAAPKTVNACMITTNAKCPGAKLQGQNLAGANMSKSNLKGANMRGANLRNAKFRGANLVGADFTGADIRGVDFSKANLNRAKLVRVKAGPPPGASATALGSNCTASLQNTGGSMVGASLNATTMTGNYSYWNFNTAWMQGINASGVNFTCATFTSVKGQSQDVVYGNKASTCVNNGQSYKTNFSKANFTGADMTGTVIIGWYMSQSINYQVCGGGNYSPPTSYYPDLTGVNFGKADLTNVILRYTKLPSTTSSLISGAIWSNTTCPQSNVTTGAPCSPTSP
jgi:uncharacterized protein YjbI with pentapeptide repeats